MQKTECLRKKPFCLNDNQVKWVEQTLDGMSLDEKIGQLFCLITYSSNESYLRQLVDQYHIGGVMARVMPLEECVESSNILQRYSKVPMLISANLEAGGDGMIIEGTSVGPNMQIAATGKPELAYEQGRICGLEGAAVGANWGFAPVIDIDMNYRNPITNTRTYGSDEEIVKEFGINYVKGIQSQGVAASIKHFPGDGVDDRDQHLVTSVNYLSCVEWDETYGKVYQGCIDAGALTVMVGHIMLPAYSRRFSPGIKDKDILPASLSKELTTNLLKEQLGFNGLVITDSTTMAGLGCAMSREKAVPATIAAGCDMFLFTKNLDEDFSFMRKGYDDGVITPERLDEAVLKVLALKAALKLPKKQKDGSIFVDLAEAKKVVGCKESYDIAKKCAKEAVTLVKQTKEILPLESKKYKRILIFKMNNGADSYTGSTADPADDLKEMFEKDGFEVSVFVPAPGFEGAMGRYMELVESYDLLLYIGNYITKSNQTTVRMEWSPPLAVDCPAYSKRIPTVFVSFANPYHLQDVPSIPVYINAYKYTPQNVEAVYEKLTGESSFVGKSPVDAFCGKWDTRL